MFLIVAGNHLLILAVALVELRMGKYWADSGNSRMAGNCGNGTTNGAEIHNKLS